MKWKDLIEPSSIPIALTGFVLAFSYSGILSFIPIYAKELGLSEIASYFFILYALVVVISRPFTGKIFDRFGENVLVYPAIIIFTIGMFILSQAQTSFWFLGAGMLIGLGYGTLIPSFKRLRFLPLQTIDVVLRQLRISHSLIVVLVLVLSF